MKQKAIIFDIDGVLSQKYPDRQWRQEDLVHLDTPITQIKEIFSDLIKNTDAKIFFLTGRTEQCREETYNWICNNYGPKDFSLLMRDCDDWRRGFEVKKDMFDKIKTRYEVFFAIDDDPEICKMYKENNIFTLEVRRDLNYAP